MVLSAGEATPKFSCVATLPALLSPRLAEGPGADTGLGVGPGGGERLGGFGGVEATPESWGVRAVRIGGSSRLLWLKDEDDSRGLDVASRLGAGDPAAWARGAKPVEVLVPSMET